VGMVGCAARGAGGAELERTVEEGDADAEGAEATCGWAEDRTHGVEGATRGRERALERRTRASGRRARVADATQNDVPVFSRNFSLFRSREEEMKTCSVVYAACRLLLLYTDK
jgi:hypothetical protein